MKTDQPTAAAADETYVLGRSEAETRRLILQGRFQNPFTKRLLEDAGIAPGMKVLDAGSGAGDVALIAAELVGPRGSILGVDMNPAVLGVARERVRKAGLGNVAFVEADLGSPRLGEGFDAVVGRFVLMYQPDPARTLGALAGRVCPGGIVAFQEMNLHPESSWFSPPTPLWRRFWGWSQALGPKTGMESEMGYKLHRTYLDSGLPAPEMQLEAMVGGGPEWGGYEYAAQTLRSLLPLMVRLGVVTEEEVEIDTLARRLREETVAAGGVVKMPEVVSAWAIKP
jgi:ubiquinone/menaquinone biosynthesis C-methylase UbiE